MWTYILSHLSLLRSYPLIFWKLLFQNSRRILRIVRDGKIDENSFVKTPFHQHVFGNSEVL